MNSFANTGKVLFIFTAAVDITFAFAAAVVVVAIFTCIPTAAATMASE